MIISTKGRYALRLLIDVAENQVAGNVSLSSVAKRQDISEKYLESIVKPLVKCHILHSVRGKAGGYRLGRAAGDITVGEAMRAVEGDLCPVSCLLADAPPCPRESNCKTVPVWRGLGAVVDEYLDGITLESIVAPELAGNDYVI